MYLMEGPAQFAPRTNQLHRSGWRRPVPQLGLGDALQTAQVGTAVATKVGPAVAASIASATGSTTAVIATAAIPIAGAIAAGVLGIVALFKRLFSGPSPYDAIDSGNVESGLAACYDIWLAVSGEALAGAGEPKSWKQTGDSKSYVNLDTWSKRTSAYPNVPNGPQGDLSIDIDQAIAGVNEIVAQVAGQLGGAPGVPYSNGDAAKHLQQSLSNPFFTNGGGGVIPLLEKVKAAREAAGTPQATGLPLPGGAQVSAASLLPVAAGVLLLLGLSHSAGE